MSDTRQTPDQELNMLRDLGVDIPEGAELVDATPQEETPAEAVKEDALARMMGEVAPQPVVEERALTQEEIIQAALDSMPRYPLGHVVPLKFPVNLPNGNQFKEFVFRKPVTGEMMEILPMQEDQYTWTHMLALIGMLTDTPSATMKKVQAPDITNAMGVAMSFFAVGPQIGD